MTQGGKAALWAPGAQALWGPLRRGSELAALLAHQGLKFPASLVAPRLPCERVRRRSGLAVEGAAQSRKG